MKIIINADDFGYSNAINYGVIDCLQEGILTAATLFSAMPGTKHAIQLAKENPELDVGVHLRLDLGKPVLEPKLVPSLLNEQGTFKTISEWKKTVDFSEKELYLEWRAQIQAIIDAGISITHIDSHHHLHMNKKAFPIYLKLAKEFQVAIRLAPMHGSEEDYYKQFPELHDVINITTFDGGFYADSITSDFFEKMPYRKNTIIEFMSHPGYLDNIVLNGSSYNHKRLTEIDVLTSPKTIEILANRNIQLTNFRDNL